MIAYVRSRLYEKSYDAWTWPWNFRRKCEFQKCSICIVDERTFFQFIDLTIVLSIFSLSCSRFN